MAERQQRERIVRPDGTTAVQTKPPRADLLRYPHHADLVTVLVRHTHDLDVARQLAQQRWQQHALDRAATQPGGERCVVIDPPRRLARHRVGWWVTLPPGPALPATGALDEQGRRVVWCEGAAHGRLGPGIEFRP